MTSISSSEPESELLCPELLWVDCLSNEQDNSVSNRPVFWRLVWGLTSGADSSEELVHSAEGMSIKRWRIWRIGAMDEIAEVRYACSLNFVSRTYS